MKRYAVITPEFETHPSDDINPPEYGCDYIEVEAENKRDARLLAVKLWRQQGGYRLYVNYYDDQCPFAHLEVIEVDNSGHD